MPIVLPNVLTAADPASGHMGFITVKPSVKDLMAILCPFPDFAASIVAEPVQRCPSTSRQNAGITHKQLTAHA